MGDITGFMKYGRQEYKKEAALERVKHYREFIALPEGKDLRTQGARCMDCGVPFCQSGCPIGNIIPDFNDLVYKDRWQEAMERLSKTNNFPEFTGRVCPAPCENSCVLGINDPPVTIKNIELAIVENAYNKDELKPRPPKHRTGKTVAVVGSGPSGLACADQLNQQGHKVTVFEKNQMIGGLLALGIPDFKLEKWVIDRRVDRMREEGITFKTGVHIAVDIPAKDLVEDFDAVVLCAGAEQPRELPIPGRELEGIYQAMYFLPQQNLINNHHSIDPFIQTYAQHNLQVKPAHLGHVSAKGKRVVVLGGGDTGSDCVGTSIRQGAVSVKQLELMPQPPAQRAAENPWPQWALIQRTSTSHEEGCERHYAVLTKRLSGKDGKLTTMHLARLQWDKDPLTSQLKNQEIPHSDFEIECDMLLLALGFVGPVKGGLITDLRLELDARGCVKADRNKMTSVEGVFVAGDMTRGQSLVVWAIHEGRSAAEGIHRFLMGKSAVKSV